MDLKRLFPFYKKGLQSSLILFSLNDKNYSKGDVPYLQTKGQDRKTFIEWGHIPIWPSAEFETSVKDFGELRLPFF